MAKAHRRQCRQPGCDRRIEPKSGLYCSEHRKTNYGRHPLYGLARWKKFRLRILRLRPVCEICDEEPSNEVHHIQSVWDYPDLWYVETNVKATCKPCHSRETYEEVLKPNR